jgi:hypothetical protein
MTTPDSGALDLDAIQTRADAATEGPWMSATHTGRKDGIALVGRTADRGTGNAVAVFAAPDVMQRKADADFTAAARIDVPALLAEVRHLRAQRDAVLALCDDMAGGPERGQSGYADDIRNALGLACTWACEPRCGACLDPRSPAERLVDRINEGTEGRA